MNGITRLAPLILMALPSRGLVGQSPLEIPLGPTCTADTAMVAGYDRTTVLGQWHGVVVTDPLSERIAGFSARKFGVNHQVFAQIAGAAGDGNWVPITGQKEIFCGAQHRFGFFPRNDSNEGEYEKDLNIFVVPEGPSRTLLEAAKAGVLVDPSHVWKCASEDCVEAEVTPDDDALAVEWYRVDDLSRHATNLSSELDGRQMCLYGAWVAEMFHEGRPEIHPIEAVWFESTDPGQGVTLFLIRDNSLRFSSASDYFAHKRVTGPLGHQPWTRDPMLLDIRTAFEVSRSGGPQVLRATLVTDGHAAQHDSAVVERIRVLDGSRRLMSVWAPTELDPDDIEIVSTCTSGDRVLGELRFRASLGSVYAPQGRQRSNYHVWTLTSSLNAPPLVVSPASDGRRQQEVPPVRPLASSIVRDPSGIGLQGDFRLLIQGTLLDVMEASFSSTDALGLKTVTLTTTNRTVTLPVFEEGDIEIRVSGRTLRYHKPGVKLWSPAQAEALPPLSDAREEWPALADRAGLDATYESPGRTVRASRWRVELEPQYQEVAYGEPLSPDPEGFAEGLNVRIQSGTLDDRAVFGDGPPLRYELDFDGGVRSFLVEPLGTSSRPVFLVEAGNSGQFELNGTARTLDPFGNADSVRITLPVAYVVGDTPGALAAQAMASTAGWLDVSVSELEAAADSSTVGGWTRGRINVARTLVTTVRQSTADNRIVLSELSAIARLGRLLQRTP